MSGFTTLAEIDSALEEYYPSRINRYAYTTEYVAQFLDFLGNPQDVSKAIHVAGTSGKTSTSYYVAALLKQSGKRVGLMISPHMKRINERVQIDLVPLEETSFCEEMSVFMDLVKKSNLQLTYAEILYSFAFWAFARQRVEYIVVEVGMGGLLDATNVMNRADKVCVIADIGIDHTNVLGDTLPEIAAHKAGIIHTHNAVFCHAQAPAIMAVIHEVSRRQEADLHIVDPVPMPEFLPLFQKRNFNLALNTVEYVLARDGGRLGQNQVTLAARTVVPARMQVMRCQGKTVIFDTAHNPQKLRALCLSIEDKYPGKSVAVLAAFLGGRGRKVEELLIELAPIVTHLIITSLPFDGVHMSREPEDVASMCRQACIDSYEIVTDPVIAYKTLLQRAEDLRLVTGSNYLLEMLLPD